MKHPSFKPTLEKVWTSPVSGPPQLKLATKLNMLSAELKHLNFKEFCGLEDRAKVARAELDEAQIMLDDDPLNPALVRRTIDARDIANKLNQLEFDYLTEKTRCKHLTLSDKNTKYFYSLVKGSRTRNSVQFLKQEDGTTTFDQAQIVGAFTNFYEDLLGTFEPVRHPDLNIWNLGPKLTASQREDMLGTVSIEEIKATLFGIDSDKAPGPDGFTAAFFKENWVILENDFTDAIMEFFTKGLLLRKLNHTILTLIPKKAHEPGVRDYRPIALTNVIYKCITKIITNRIGPCLQHIISPAQAAFIKGRSIMDNIFLAQELVRQYGRTQQISPRAMMKIDLQKAFDSVSWSFLHHALIGLNFHPHIIYWIMTCVTCPTFTIALNGGTHGFIHGKRGLRQGDPMSPTLFIICMEYFSRLLAARTQDPSSDFRYHPKCIGNNLTHLIFADDLLLFGHGDPNSMGILAKALEDFGSISGLRVSKPKSQVFLCGVANYPKQQILDAIGFVESKLPTNYLGLPLASVKLEAVHFNPLYEAIDGYIKKWANKNLSMAGRIELIKSVLEGINCYWLQAFPLPATVIDRIESTVRNFMWGSKSCPVSFNQVCKPKDEGGLGLRNLSDWNKALLTRNLWDIHSRKDSLWIKWIHSEYLLGRDIWEIAEHHKDSPTIKNILRIRDKLLLDCDGDPNRAKTLITSWYEGKGTADAYQHLRSKGEKHYWHKAIWKDYIPPKFSIALWLAIQGKLKTVDRLKFLNICRTCVLCNSAPESHSHLFFDCGASRAVWSKIKDWLRLQPALTTITSALSYFKRTRAGSTIMQKAKMIALASTVKYLWYARNKMIFEDRPFIPAKIVKDIQKSVYTMLYSKYLPEMVLSHMQLGTNELDDLRRQIHARQATL